MAGYCIECALKACIAKNINAHVIPDKAFVNNIYQHNLEALLKMSGLNRQMLIDSAGNSNLVASWNIVKVWKVDSRYEFKSELEAREMYNSIVNRSNGILVWIQQYW